ncbi:MAG: hypothetical protein E6Q98_18195 [Rhodospirillaceae bacterium]|nr:MAG: hypothetical protein E6Q98_18195 [Rhodospirillaceae bacterium]
MLVSRKIESALCWLLNAHAEATKKGEVISFDDMGRFSDQMMAIRRETINMERCLFPQQLREQQAREAAALANLASNVITPRFGRPASVPPKGGAA